VTYRLHPEAALEHEEQIGYYEARSVGLGRKYHAAAMQAISKAVATPHRFKLARQPNLRQVRLSGFPFTVIYRAVDDEVQVLAVAHHRRHPDYWSVRI
jgi:plasmid stabilization system protein ParE